MKSDKISTNGGNRKTLLTIPSSVLVAAANPFSPLEGSCRCVAGGEHLSLTTRVMIPRSDISVNESGSFPVMILGSSQQNIPIIPGIVWTYMTIGVEPENK